MALPIAITDAGPVGLAAAAHLLARGLTPVVFEAGDSIVSAVHAWSHVRMFSPWRYNIDDAARAVLATTGWQAPDEVAYPTGAELVRDYLAPLAATPALRGCSRTGARVIGVARHDHGRLHASAPGISGRDAANRRPPARSHHHRSG